MDIYCVCIAAAYPIMRNGLIMTIEAEPQMHVVGNVGPDDLVGQLREVSVDVLVINLVGLDGGPVAVIRELRQAFPRLAIVIVADAVDFAPELLAAGVHGYISYAAG